MFEPKSATESNADIKQEDLLTVSKQRETEGVGMQLDLIWKHRVEKCVAFKTFL